MSPPQRYDRIKQNTFLSRKLEELVIIQTLQNFSVKMLPYFNPETYPFLNEFYSSIMASDSSPTGEYKEFSYTTPGGRSTPPPTTSYLSARQESQAIAIDQNIAKPAPDNPEKQDDLKEKEQKEKDKDDADTGGPDANPGYKPEERKDEKRDQKDGGGDKEAKLNGGGKLETQFMLPLDAKDPDDEVDDSCAVNCLYYTMQCCECVIT